MTSRDRAALRVAAVFVGLLGWAIVLVQRVLPC